MFLCTKSCVKAYLCSYTIAVRMISLSVCISFHQHVLRCLRRENRMRSRTHPLSNLNIEGGDPTEVATFTARIERKIEVIAWACCCKFSIDDRIKMDFERLKYSAAALQ